MRHLLLLLSIVSAHAQQMHSTSENFTVDLLGTPDHRQSAWGDAGYQEWRITFKPPAGYQVRILHVRGNFVVASNGDFGPGLKGYALFGMLIPANAQSPYMDVGADGCLEYYQTVITSSQQGSTIGFNDDVHVAGVLGPDNVLVVRAAVFLNNTGQSLHMEPSFVMDYQFEIP